MLNQSSIFGKYALLLILLISGSVDLCAQFDSVIFVKKAPYWKEAVIYMGDQNDDGYDDFVICAQNGNTGPNGYAYFYYGGNPLSTIPAIRFPYNAPTTTTACDVNRDGYRDLVVQQSSNIKPQVIDIYLGGPGIDTVVDYSFFWVDSISNSVFMIGRHWQIDFDGDGFEEFVCFSGYNIPSGFYNDRVYFFRTDSLLTSRSYHKIELFPDQSYQFYRGSVTFSDIDGDDKTDFSINLTKKFAPASAPTNKVRFYYGNDNYDFNGFYEITDTMAYVDHTYLIQDLNNDGKGEIIFNNPGTHPDWFMDVFSFGSRPPNFTVEQGINTQAYPWAVAFSPGDINADGCNDMLRPMPYYIMNLYLGGYPMQEERTKVYSTSGNYSINFGGRVGDVDGDGVDDICIGENGFTEHPGIAPPGNIYIIKGTRTPVSVEEETDVLLKPAELDIAISPNPTNGPVTLQYTLPGPGELVTEVFNILGEKIYSSSSQGETDVHSEQIDLASRAGTSGVYILRVSLNSGGKSYSKSVKVQVVK